MNVLIRVPQKELSWGGFRLWKWRQSGVNLTISIFLSHNVESLHRKVAKMSNFLPVAGRRRTPCHFGSSCTLSTFMWSQSENKENRNHRTVQWISDIDWLIYFLQPLCSTPIPSSTKTHSRAVPLHNSSGIQLYLKIILYEHAILMDYFVPSGTLSVRKS